MILLIIFLLLGNSLYADAVTQIEAQAADYDGKKIRLSGGVHIMHEFGEISCDRGVMLLTENMAKRATPGRILLYGAVEIKLHDGSILTSEEADINCQTLEGVFTAQAPQKVIYLTRLSEGDRTVPVKTISRAMRVHMKKSDGPKSEYIIRDVQAEGAVNIEYLNGL